MAELAAVQPNKKHSLLDKNRNAVNALKLCLKKELENMELGELVDEDLRTEHGNGSQFADPDIIKQHVEEITTSVIEEQEDNNLKLLLKAESSVFLLAVLERNKNNQKKAEEFMSNLLQKLPSECQNKLEEFTINLSSFAIEWPIILQPFHKNTTEKLLLKYDELSKPGCDAFQSKYRERLLVELDKIMSTELATVRPNQDEPTQLATDKAFIDNLQSQFQSLKLKIELCTNLIAHKLPDILQKSINQHDITDNVIIGIDIGSKYCHSAVCIAGKVYKIPHYDQSGEVYQSMSTYVGVDEFEAYVGQSAQKKIEDSVEFSTIFYDVIYFLLHESCENFNSETEYINFGFTPNAENKETTRSVLLANNQTYFVAEIFKNIFRKLRDNASHILNVNVSKCVIAYSGLLSTLSLQQNVIRKGAEMAGFQDITFLKKPYAAGFCSITTKNTWKTPSTIFHIHFGSRYWVFSVFQKVQNNLKISDFEKYYGRRYDTGYLQNKLMNYCLEEFIGTHKILPISSLKSDTIENKVRFRRLHESCDKAIISLSTSQTATVHVIKFAHGLDLVVNITRAKFEELCANSFSEITKHVNDVLNRETLKIADIDYVVITGGSSRIPKVQEIINGLFGNKIIHLMDMEPEEVFAYGAAIHGAILAHK